MGNENSAEQGSGSSASNRQHNAQSQRTLREGENHSQSRKDGEAPPNSDPVGNAILWGALGAAAVGGLIWAGKNLLTSTTPAELTDDNWDARQESHSPFASSHNIVTEGGPSRPQPKPPLSGNNELNMLVRCRDRQQDLILYCVFDRAMQKRQTAENYKFSTEYQRNSEVVHNPHLYADSSVNDIDIPETRVARRENERVKNKNNAQLLQEISLLEDHRDDESEGSIRYCVFDRAIQEREKKVNGARWLDGERYENNCKVVFNLHWYINRTVE